MDRVTSRWSGRLLGTILCIGALAPLARAQNATLDRSLRVVVNKENEAVSISVDDLERVFLGKKTLWPNGVRIQPGMPEEESPTGQAFLTSALSKSVSQFRAYWKRLLFSGGGAAPKTFRSATLVLDFVARQPGGIGVVAAEAAAADDRVKVIEVTP